MVYMQDSDNDSHGATEFEASDDQTLCNICMEPCALSKGLNCCVCSRRFHLVCGGADVAMVDRINRAGSKTRFMWICVDCLSNDEEQVQSSWLHFFLTKRLNSIRQTKFALNEERASETSFSTPPPTETQIAPSKKLAQNRLTSAYNEDVLQNVPLTCAETTPNTIDSDLMWSETDSGSEPSFGRTVSEILSRFCWVFCCPPCPPCITRKIAFHPPKPPTYRILISLGGTPEMEILDETLKISSPFQMKGDVVLLHEKPNVCDTKLRRLVAMQWLHPRSAAKNNMLILHSHVNAADLGSIQFAMELLARRTGCDVISYDYCGYGGSDGTPSEDIILQNADTVMHYITQVLRRPSTSVVVYGQSIGSVPTWYLASKYDVAGVIQLSGLHSGWRTLCRKKQTSAPYGCCCLNPFNNANLVKNVSAPILLIHGTEDEVIQFSQALEMRRLCGNKAVEPLWAEGLGHMGIERTRGFYARITKFINEEIHKRVGTSTMSSSSITTDSSLEKRQSPELRASRQQQPPFQQQPPPSPQQQPPSSREEEPQEQPTQTRSPRPDVVEAGFFRKSSVKPSAPDAQSSKGTHFQTSEPASNARLQ